MRKIGWLRYGLASMSLIGAGLGSALTACGDDDAVTPLDDAGSDVSTTDGPLSDSEAEANPPVKLAKLTLVNAAADLGPDVTLPNKFQGIRLCFKQGTTDANIDYAPFPPLPDKPLPSAPQLPPALYIGTGGAFPNFGIDLSVRILVPILMNPFKLSANGIVNPGNGQPGATCDEILKGTSEAGTLTPGVDYWELPAIEAGTFQRDKSYLVVLTGCVSNATIGAPRCGPNISADSGIFLPPGTLGRGNLKITIMELTRTPVSASDIGIQVAHMSWQTAWFYGSVSVPIEPGFASAAATDASFIPVTGGPLTPMQVTSARVVTGVADTQYFMTSPPEFIPYSIYISLPDVQKVSFGDAALPTIYKGGKNFVFVLVGDAEKGGYIHENGDFALPDEPDATFNLRSYHYLGFPTDPDVANYKP